MTAPAVAIALAATPASAGAALIGAACGLRSQIGLAAVAVTARAGREPRPVAVLAGRPGRAVAVTAAVGELVADKLPSTPSRLAAAGLVPRFVLGGLSAAALAARAHDADGGEGAGEAEGEPGRPGRLNASTARIGLAAAVGGTAAIGAAFAGAWWRRQAGSSGRPDWPAAVIEDAVAVGLAGAACALAGRSATGT
jgi:uncharacterized membrane protein